MKMSILSCALLVMVVACTLISLPGYAAGSCADNAWVPSKPYTGGQQVMYAGSLYQAKWWTQGNIPTRSGTWGVWKRIGNCASLPSTQARNSTPSANVESDCKITKEADREMLACRHCD